MAGKNAGLKILKTFDVLVQVLFASPVSDLIELFA